MDTVPQAPAGGAPQIAYFGGNGHAAGRLLQARAHLGETGPGLLEAPYPGFEGRPRAADLEAFLDAIAPTVAAPGVRLVYATGIGGLLALCLRARGVGLDRPLLIQGAVLWGLETRRFPKIMRAVPGSAALLRKAFGLAVLQRRFARKHFRAAHDPQTLASFFDGYASCTAFAQFFGWLTPALLRELEATFARAPELLEGISVWDCGHEGVVGEDEVTRTERALGVTWPRRAFPEWGHYPMIDEPEAWARELRAELP